ncbi:helix-turn-helix transcriptional regulator [Granulicella sp. dw_53]|uniref:helix-turn-helix domain-containing protein n=1 Tax=Granulicella sp. dw_53 TaxID=2719792 RepID=UPI001BD5E728|nr:helix-turn-helix transcriptional regulator [Granulicella sp. dw_53]
MDEPRHPIVDVLLRLLRTLRVKQGLTLEEVADRAGIHRTHLGLIERMERQPTLSVAVQIAKSFDLDLSDLLLKAELIQTGKLREEEAFRDLFVRIEKPECLRNLELLELHTGLSGAMLLKAIHGCYTMLDTIDSELVANGSPPIGGLVELANLSSMVGNMVGGAIAETSEGLYARNKPHHYPDLLPLRDPAKNLELKMALETNKPKGHLPKAGTYITIRYVLGDRAGTYARKTRGNTVWIWEVKVGLINIGDFDISNTEGDSGKTAVIKTTVFNAMPLVYFDPSFCPYDARRGSYPGLN